MAAAWLINIGGGVTSASAAWRRGVFGVAAAHPASGLAAAALSFFRSISGIGAA